MVGFQTKNSTYYVDLMNKTITGGYFGDAIVPYINLQVIIGCNAIIQLFDGRVISTGRVKNYI